MNEPTWEHASRPCEVEGCLYHEDNPDEACNLDRVGIDTGDVVSLTFSADCPRRRIVQGCQAARVANFCMWESGDEFFGLSDHERDILAECS